MPSVASEVRQTLSAQAQRPSSRPQGDAATPDSSPFAELLDSTNPTDDTPPPAPPARLTSGNQANPSAEPRDTDPVENKRADSGSSTQNASPAAQGQAADDASPAATGVVAADAAAKAGKTVKAEADAGSPDDTDSKADASDTTATPAVPSPAGATPAPVPAIPSLLELATPAASTDTASPDAAEAGALNALQAAQATGSTGPMPKATPGQKNLSAPAAGETKSDDQAADAPALDAGPIDPEVAAPQPDAAGKDAQGHARDDIIPVAFRHAADLLKGVEAGASAPRDTDATGAVKGGADAVQNLGIAGQANPANATANATGTVTASAPAQPAAIPLAGLAVAIATQADAGNHHFEIRLDPPELGRIDVRLSVDRNGNVSTQLVADRSDTLDLLRRDSGQLQQALQDAGLKTSDNALQFSLRQQGFTQDDTPSQNGSGSVQAIVSDDDPAPIEALRQGYGRLLGLGGGLDIRV